MDKRTARTKALELVLSLLRTELEYEPFKESPQRDQQKIWFELAKYACQLEKRIKKLARRGPSGKEIK